MIPQIKAGMKDITSQCNFINCTFDGGRVLVDETSKIVYLSVMITPTVTNSWKTIIELPVSAKCLPVVESQSGTGIIASEFWAYNLDDKVEVRGSITSGNQIIIQGFYFKE